MNVTPNKQRGFGAAAVIGIIALLAILGSFIASSMSSSATKTDKSEHKLLATSLMVQAGTIKDALFVLKQTDPDIKSVQNITLDGAAKQTATLPATVGLFNSADGASEFINPPPQAFPAGARSWVMNTDNALTATGSTYISVGALLPQVCVAINDALEVPSGERAVGSTDRTAFCDETADTFYRIVQFN